MTASTETFESVRDRIMAHIRSRGTDAPPAAVHQKLAAAYSQFDTTLAGLAEGVPTAPAVFWAEIDGEPTEWVEELDWRAYAAVLRVHALEHLAQLRAILAAVA